MPARASLKTAVALIAFGATAVGAFGAIPRSQSAPFTFCNPDPDVLVWDTAPVPGELETYVGWLKVPILHEQPSLERLGVPLGFTALRVAGRTQCAADAKPILTVCVPPPRCALRPDADGRAPVRSTAAARARRTTA